MSRRRPAGLPSRRARRLGIPDRLRLALRPEDAAAVADRLALLAAARFAERLHRGDPSLWSDDPAVRRMIRRRLGWLGVLDRMLGEAPRLEGFAATVRSDGIRDVVLLGMGGSSLAPLVWSRVFGAAHGFPRLHVLDTTVPSAIRRVEREIDAARALFLVSSKSGTTTETLSLQAYFWERMRRLRRGSAARHFAVVTDPGTPLAETAASRGYRAAFHNPDDIGGRYSALSYFGLVPASLLGVDVRGLLARALEMRRLCGPGFPPSENPGLLLGAFLGALGRRGRDKIALVVDPRLRPFELWIEQLIAESTGKNGLGLLPIPASPGAPAADLAGPDRVAAAIALSGAERDGRGGARPFDLFSGGVADGVPACEVLLKDRLDLGAAILQWEIATVVAAAAIEVNPFDEPDVGEAKKGTEAALAEFATHGRFVDEPPVARAGRTSVFASPGVAAARPPSRAKREPSGDGARLGPLLRALFERAAPGDYGALLVFADPDDAMVARLMERARATLARRFRLAATAGYGPRYLHSTGQIHKGGPDTGRYVIVVPRDRLRVRVPGAAHDFETLKRAQAIGDYRALVRRGRSVVRIDFAAAARPAARVVLRALEAAAALPAAPARPARVRRAAR